MNFLEWSLAVLILADLVWILFLIRRAPGKRKKKQRERVDTWA